MAEPLRTVRSGASAGKLRPWRGAALRRGWAPQDGPAGTGDAVGGATSCSRLRCLSCVSVWVAACVYACVQTHTSLQCSSGRQC